MNSLTSLKMNYAKELMTTKWKISPLNKGDKLACSSKGFCKVYMNPQSRHMCVALACKILYTISVWRKENK